MTMIPSTNTVVSYAYTIMAKGKKVGTLQGFNPSSNRTLERLREIMNETDDIVEIVPGRSEITLTIERFETYNAAVMSALGYDLFGEDLSKVVDPIDIQEIIQGPVSKGSPRRTITYQNCWIQNWAKTVREGTITVTETVTLWPERIVKGK